MYAATGTARRNFEHWHDMHGVALKTVSADAGTHWALHNLHGSLIHTWDSRGFRTTTAYDLLQRPVEVYVEGDDGDGLVLQQVVERLTYGDGVHDAQEAAALNLRGRLVEHYDQAGLIRVDSYSHHGLPLQVTRQLRTTYRSEADWSTNDAEQWQTQLDDEAFVTRIEHDALGRVTRVEQPSDDILAHAYHAEGWVSQLQLQRAEQPEAGQEAARNPVAEMSVRIDYDARGQRTQVRYGDHVTTAYAYDTLTHRLAQLTSWRTGDDGALQALTYAYDPVGNITRIRDGIHAAVVTDQAIVDGVSDYTYDSLDRLVRATGREHLSLTNSGGSGAMPDTIVAGRDLNLNNLEQLRPYVETYSYDHAGNRVALRHRGEHSWTQSVTVAAASNRADSIDGAGNGAPMLMHYDAHGNLRGWDASPDLQWTARDNLAAVDLVLRPEQPFDDREYYVYDSGGRRVRKVTETLKSSSERGLLIEINETIYLGALDIHRLRREVRRFDGDGKLVSVTDGVRTGERHSLYLMDDDRRVGVCHRWPAEANAKPTKAAQVRYQLDDHLGSVALELTADGRRISYEEYYPFGGTALIAGRDEMDVSPKTYRYSGKERDTSTGFYYYGARYYAAWLGRWLSPDPAGTVDGLNLYAFVSENPIKFADHEGLAKGNRTVAPEHAEKTIRARAQVDLSEAKEQISQKLEGLKKYSKGKIENLKEQSKKMKNYVKQQAKSARKRLKEEMFQDDAPLKVKANRAANFLATENQNRIDPEEKAEWKKNANSDHELMKDQSADAKHMAKRYREGGGKHEAHIFEILTHQRKGPSPSIADLRYKTAMDAAFKEVLTSDGLIADPQRVGIRMADHVYNVTKGSHVSARDRRRHELSIAVSLRRRADLLLIEEAIHAKLLRGVRVPSFAHFFQ